MSGNPKPIDAEVAKSLADAFLKVFGPPRLDGKAYIVGEKGPEIIVPATLPLEHR